MSEERITKLEVAVVDLRVDAARFNEGIEHLAKAVDELRVVVQDLRDTMNRGKGAISILVLAGGAIGGLLSWVAKRLFEG